MFYITYPSIKNGLRVNKSSIERVLKPFRRFAVITLVSTSIISFALIGCSAPGTATKPSSSIYRHTVAREEGTANSSMERVPHWQEVESAKEKGVETGTWYASLPPPETEIAKLAERKEGERGILDFTPVINSEVEGYIRYFSDDRHRIFKKWLERYNRYGPMMRRILAAHGLPEDLVFVAMVESGFSPYAYSRSRAVGPWQFISGTGLRYGLTINWWIDERNDPVKSTYAAARYLKDLYAMFGSWPLALAGYNAGEMRVKNALEQTGLADFWGLARTNQLKRETKEYVPQIMAASIIAKNPEKYGFDDVNYTPRLVYEEVEINESTDLKTLARMAGITYEELKDLNPELRKGMTPPNYSGYKLKIPYGFTYTFLANYKKNIEADGRVAWQRHRVNRGETLFIIARKHDVSVDAIVSLNKLKNQNILRAGMDIRIPVAADEQATGTPVVSAKDGVAKADTGMNLEAGAGRDKVRSAQQKDVSHSSSRSTGENESVRPEKVAQVVSAKPGQTPTTSNIADYKNREAEGQRIAWQRHRVNRGETLFSIARKYGTSVDAIVSLNKLKNRNTLRAGTGIRIPVAANEQVKRTLVVSAKDGVTKSDNKAAQVASAKSGRTPTTSKVASVGVTPASFERDSGSPKALVTYKGGHYKELFHTVEKGHTLWRISRSYRVDLQELMQWNGLNVGQRIRPGDVLQILVALD